MRVDPRTNLKRQNLVADLVADCPNFAGNCSFNGSVTAAKNWPNCLIYNGSGRSAVW
jgi:hypothetical protein